MSGSKGLFSGPLAPDEKEDRGEPSPPPAT